MKKISTLVLFLFNLVFSSNSYADWTKVGEGIDGDTYYVDFERLKKKDSNIFFWELHNYLKPTKFGDMSVKSFKEVDCYLLSYKFLSDTYYSKQMGKGSINASSNIPDKEWRYPHPGSIGETVLKSVCSK